VAAHALLGTAGFAAIFLIDQPMIAPLVAAWAMAAAI
jgi:hypothetical protein